MLLFFPDLTTFLLGLLRFLLRAGLDASEQLGCRFVLAAFGGGEGVFGGDEFASEGLS